MASSDSWCQSTISSLASSHAEAQQTQSLLSGSCEKYLAANRRLYMALVDLEKAFDRVPWKVIWWALRKLGVKGFIARWCRGCMPMCGAMSMLGRDTVSLK